MLRSRRWGIGPLRAHACKCLRLPPLRPLGIQRMNQRSSGSPNSGLSLMHLACPDALGPAERQPERAADRRPRVRMPQGPARLLKHGFVREWQVPSPILFSKRTTSPRCVLLPRRQKATPTSRGRGKARQRLIPSGCRVFPTSHLNHHRTHCEFPVCSVRGQSHHSRPRIHWQAKYPG